MARAFDQSLCKSARFRRGTLHDPHARPDPDCSVRLKPKLKVARVLLIGKSVLGCHVREFLRRREARFQRFSGQLGNRLALTRRDFLGLVAQRRRDPKRDGR